MDTRAVIYLVNGDEYLKEAEVSIKSLPDGLAHCVITPKLEFSYWYLNCVSTLAGIFVNPALEQYNQFLLLDTDTFVCGNLDDFFTILNRFDIAGTQAIGRETMLHRQDIPASFPELHVGAISFKRNERVYSLFQLWFNLYQAAPDLYGNNDQGPLREALWRMPEVRLGILPAEFCFRYRWGGLISGPVRVLHGRQNGTPYEQIAREVNGKGIRVYKRRELA